METANECRTFFKNFPKLVLFETTTRCNLNCSYCVARSMIKNPSDLPLETIMELKDKLAVFEYVALCGLGESTVHKDFYQIIELFKDQKIILITNGSVPLDYQRLTAYNNVASISFSVDGTTEETVRKICSNYKYANLEANLEGVAASGINTAFNCTISRENIDELHTLGDMAVKYGINRVKMGLPLGQTRWVKANFERIHSILHRLEKGLEGTGVIYEGPFVKKCTIDEAPIAVVSKNGNVYPCCDYYCGRPKVGNLFMSDFMSMWESRAYEDFRTGRFCAPCKQYHNNHELIEWAKKLDANIPTETEKGC